MLTKVVFAAVLTGAWAAACVLSGPSPNFGAILTQDGSIALYYKPCHASTRIYALSLSDDGPTTPVELWAIESAGGSQLRMFNVGEAPDGFTTKQALPDPRSLPSRLRITFKTDELPRDDEAFVKADLRSDKLRVGNQYESLSEFLSSDTCG